MTEVVISLWSLDYNLSLDSLLVLDLNSILRYKHTIRSKSHIPPLRRLASSSLAAALISGIMF